MNYKIILFGIIGIIAVGTISYYIGIESKQPPDEIISTFDEKSMSLCDLLGGTWNQEYLGCQYIPENQCGGYYVKIDDACNKIICSLQDKLICIDSFSNYRQIVEGTQITLEGVVIDNTNSGEKPVYRFFTNEPYVVFNTGSDGIRLEGLEDNDNLHGKIVKLSGIRTDRDLSIRVNDVTVLDSLIPSGNVPGKVVREVSLDEIYKNPDKYYNQMISVSGSLEEYEHGLANIGVGCHTARYTASSEFVPDFPSSRHLYSGEKKIGVRMHHDDLGKVENPLLDEMNTNKTTVTGVLIPNVVAGGKCEHVIYKSGYLLTTPKDIKIE